ncbi:MAG: Thiosulfate sulfurtransferase, rhodanese, partial [uncultured Phycisphaerae bacterium]
EDRAPGRVLGRPCGVRPHLVRRDSHDLAQGGERVDRAPRRRQTAARARHPGRLQGLLPRAHPDRPPHQLRHAARHGARRAGPVPAGRPHPQTAGAGRRGQGPDARPLRDRRRAAERRGPQREHGRVRAGETRRDRHPHPRRRAARLEGGRLRDDAGVPGRVARGRRPRRAGRGRRGERRRGARTEGQAGRGARGRPADERVPRRRRRLAAQGPHPRRGQLPLGQAHVAGQHARVQGGRRRASRPRGRGDHCRQGRPRVLRHLARGEPAALLPAARDEVPQGPPLRGVVEGVRAPEAAPGRDRARRRAGRGQV